MKLKTSPRYLLNLYCSLYLIIGLGCFTSKAFSKETEIPGLIESLEKLQKLHTDQFQKVKNQINSKSNPDVNLSKVKEFKIDPYFMRSILFQSDNRYLSLIQNDECKFYSLLEMGLLKSNEDKENIILKVTNTDGSIQNISVSQDTFFEELYRRKCLNIKEFNVLFNEKNFQKTIQGIKFTTPKGDADCKSIHEEWLLNSYTPYLCKINQVLKSGKNLDKEKLNDSELALKKSAEMYLTKIPLMQRNYIESLCNNLNDYKPFCENYLKSDVWNKVINGEKPNYKLNYKCAEFLRLEGTPTLKDQQLCANKFLSDIKICETNRKKDFPAFFPMQNCDLASSALNNSKLISDYQDCPGNIDNEAITNIHRIINHFSPRKINSTPENCTGEANYSFARLNLDIKYEKGWPLKVCFFNRVQNKEECVPYIPGSRETEPLSEDQVISKILYLHKGVPAKTSCRIVSSKKYNPLRTEFKFGCFIIYNPDACTTLSCDKKVIWDDKVQTDIKFIGNPIFEYYPSAYSNERYSIQNLLYEVKNIQSRSVKSLTELKFYLDKIPNGIIHGVGCAEDLIPDIYIRTVINQCHPLTFIISGYVIKNSEPMIIVHSAIDELFSPRLLPWMNIYNSVASYKELHPLNTWTLHGLKK